MDGRCQEAVGKWARKEFGVDFPDTITIAGADGVLIESSAEQERAHTMAKISAEKHGSKCAAIVGHSGCAGFPVSDDEHKKAVASSAAIVKGWGLFDVVVGLYHDVESRGITEVCRLEKRK